MADFARSDDPAVQAQLDRLGALSPGRDILGLERIAELCRRLGDPQNRLPRTFHVAGTNGKGSTCAFLRAILEAQGRRVHAFTRPGDAASQAFAREVGAAWAGGASSGWASCSARSLLVAPQRW
mgnify:CR=1 FL=1